MAKHQSLMIAVFTCLLSVARSWALDASPVLPLVADSAQAVAAIDLQRTDLDAVKKFILDSAANAQVPGPMTQVLQLW